MPMKDKSFLGRYTLLSGVILLAADLAAVPGDVAEASIVMALAGFIWTVLVAGVAGFLVFLNEYVESKDFTSSFVGGLIAAFLIMIPTPIVGVITGSLIVVKQLR